MASVTVDRKTGAVVISLPSIKLRLPVNIDSVGKSTATTGQHTWNSTSVKRFHG